jgi:hypothetical protein
MKQRIFIVLIIIGFILTMVTGNDVWWKKAIGIPVWFLMAMFIAWLVGFIWRVPFWKRVKVPFVILLYFGVVNQLAFEKYGDPYKSISGISHNCTYCGKQYKNNGYYHLEYECIEYKTDPGFDDHCSVKCCSEDWKLKGSGKYH